MRMAFSFIASLLLVTLAFAQGKGVKPRYNVEPNLDKFPQKTAKETLASVIKAVEEKRIDYLLAHLADPEFVDTHVQKTHRGKFPELVKEVTDKLVNNPNAIKKLRRFLKAGEWEADEMSASAHLKDVPERVFFRKIEGRWYFEDKKK